MTFDAEFLPDLVGVDGSLGAFPAAGVGAILYDGLRKVGVVGASESVLVVLVDLPDRVLLILGVGDGRPGVGGNE